MAKPTQLVEFRVEHVADSKNLLTIEDMANQPFTLTNNHMANYGLRNHAVWLRITFSTLQLTDIDRLLLSVNFPPLDDVQIYIPKDWVARPSYTQWQASAIDNYVKKQLGDQFPYQQRDIESANHAIDFLPNNRISTPIYIRVKTSTSLQAPIRIFTPNDMARDQYIDSLIYGAYFGLMLVMIFYNGFIFLTTRMTAYFYYVLFNCALFLVQISNRGIAYQFLWPDAVWWNQNSIFIGSGFVFAFSALFIRSFMDTKNSSPIYDKLLLTGAFIGFGQTILTIVGFFELSVKISVVAGLFIPLTALILGLTRLYKGDRRAVLFVSAWTVLLVAAIAWHLTLSGILTMTKATSYYLIIGSSIEVILLSLALADEINHQRRNALIHEQNEERFLLEKQAAEQANQAKSIFLTNISHELRTPLNAILGFTKRVINTTQDQLTKKQSDALKVVVNNADHLLQLVNNLIDVSQVESGKFKLNFTSISLNSVCNDVRHQLQSLADEKRLTLRVELDANAPNIPGDLLRIKQVVINLVNNAIKFTDNGSVTIKTEVKAIENKDYVLVKIIDTGIGISEEYQSSIFARFQRDETHNRASKVDGYGIGLSLCKEIVDRHDGLISFESTTGVGTTFTVCFPSLEQEIQQPPSH